MQFLELWIGDQRIASLLEYYLDDRVLQVPEQSTMSAGDLAEALMSESRRNRGETSGTRQLQTARLLQNLLPTEPIELRRVRVGA